MRGPKVRALEFLHFGRPKPQALYQALYQLSCRFAGVAKRHTTDTKPGWARVHHVATSLTNEETRGRGLKVRALDCGSLLALSHRPAGWPLSGGTLRSHAASKLAAPKRQPRCRTPRRAPPANVQTSDVGSAGVPPARESRRSRQDDGAATQTTRPRNVAVQRTKQPFGAGWLTEVAQPIEHRILKKKYRLLPDNLDFFVQIAYNNSRRAVRIDFDSWHGG